VEKARQLEGWEETYRDSWTGGRVSLFFDMFKLTRRGYWCGRVRAELGSWSLEGRNGERVV
jgi:hypothetical protein